MTAAEILAYGFHHIAVATGSTWRRDGVGRWHSRGIELDEATEILTPDEVMDGVRPHGERVAVFDDDHYYMGGELAELLVKWGYSVVLVTPEPEVSSWTHKTMEQHRIQGRLLDLGVEIVVGHTVQRAGPDGLVVRSIYNARERIIECDSSVFVTGRLPNESLYLDLTSMKEAWPEAGLSSVRAVGDAFSPGSIAAAVWDGRRFAEELGGVEGDEVFPRDVAVV